MRCLQCVCPSNGACDLQKLGVEYTVTSNELVRPQAKVRSVEPQHEHPFIRRDMDRCIACGKCVRVCRDVAGPACYDFTGRGFMMNVDTPYGEALQLADCITCGRCVTDCPTGALTFNERALQSFRVDESRCILCKECVNVCPVDALKETNHFEQARSQWLELVAQGSKLAGGHRLCAGCGASIVVRQVLMGTADPVVVGAATGCLEVSTTIYPYTSWKVPLHPQRLRERGRDALRRRGRVQAACKSRARLDGRTSSSSPSAATAAPTTSACSRSPAPWSAATTWSTSATTTAPT